VPSRSVVVRTEERPAAIGGWRDFVLRVDETRNAGATAQNEADERDVRNKRCQRDGADNSVLARSQQRR
jgi:hypothetical protein